MTKQTDVVEKFKARLNINAIDFDSIVMDMLNELVATRAELEKYKKEFGIVCVDALQKRYEHLDDLSKLVRIDFHAGEPIATLPPTPQRD